MDPMTALLSATAVTIAVVALILSVLGAIAATDGGISRFHERNGRAARSAGHVADDPRCAYWRGDFAGVDLTVECPKCASIFA